MMAVFCIFFIVVNVFDNIYAHPFLLLPEPFVLYLRQLLCMFKFYFGIAFKGRRDLLFFERCFEAFVSDFGNFSSSIGFLFV